MALCLYTLTTCSHLCSQTKVLLLLRYCIIDGFILCSLLGPGPLKPPEYLTDFTRGTHLDTATQHTQPAPLGSIPRGLSLQNLFSPLPF